MPDETTSSGRNAFGEIGISGLKHHNGIIAEEFLRDLKGRRGAQVIRQMVDNDSVIGSILLSVETGLRAVEWTVEPWDDTPDKLEEAEFVEECLDDMSHSWPDFIAEALSKVAYGWAFFETIYKRREGPNGAARSKHNDGKIGWRKHALRAQDTLDRWEIDDAGGIGGMWQRAERMGLPTVFIPIEKALLFRTSIRKNNPEGRSMLRTAYISWYRKDRIETGEMIGVDRDLVGLPMVELPAYFFGEGATEEQQAIVREWKKIITQVRSGEQAGIVAPRYLTDEGEADWSFSLISSPGEKTYDTTKIIERLTKHIAISTLQDIVLLGHEHAGSLALADTKKAQAQHALKAQLDEIAATMNQHAIPRLFRLNGMNEEELPRLVPGEIGERQMEQISNLIAATSNAGMGWFPSPDGATENQIRTWAGFDPVDPADDDGTMFEPTPPEPDTDDAGGEGRDVDADPETNDRRR